MSLLVFQLQTCINHLQLSFDFICAQYVPMMVNSKGKMLCKMYMGKKCRKPLQNTSGMGCSGHLCIAHPGV